MKNNVLNVVENVTIALGVAISIETIYSIMGIVLLIFQIGMIIAKVIVAVRKHLKEKNYEEVKNEIECGVNNIESVIKEHDNKSKQ